MRPLRPKRLRPGDTIAIAAPSGPALPQERDWLDAATAVFEGMGFRVRRTELVESGGHHFWRSAPPAAQAAEFNALLNDPEIRAIVPFTGGNATTAYLDRIDYDAIRRDPKPLLGFSDITALHLACHSQTGLVGFHADFAPGFSGLFWDGSTPERHAEIAELVRGLLTGELGDVALPAERTWETWRPGTATGRLVGGLLDRLVNVQASPYALAPETWDGAVFFWEDVGRNLGHVWNQLHLLRMQGVFDRCGAMVVGIPSDIPDRDLPDGRLVGVKDIVLDVLGDYDVPVLAGVDFGHTGPNLPMPIGTLAAVDAGARELRLLESPVD
ncbi:LD-carboxypeptidase [Glycomyces sp. TRM65418]|uniref:S66 peptidase family protein n=1 Tax=Glycomyces sp. TRM65418 TaxID=2867006 RepID=UPI001CE510C6|nr:S66 peptidase family protein [Glycomyces sp. TRM65418]MCC3764189.1 LD-carboxypeptidase [Glycomyces sp. TRM65418]QZD53873.1 LD-carboxypeptidase [Glycomyces sp. TRM65418]